jgi:hypothetical protein
MQPSSKRQQRQTGKTKPMTTGKNTGYNRPVTPGKNPRPVSTKPSKRSKLLAAAKSTSSGSAKKATKLLAAAKSTSSGKEAGRTPSVDSRAERSNISTAKVTSSSKLRKARAKVTSSSKLRKARAKVTTGAEKSGSSKLRAAKQSTKLRAAKQSTKLQAAKQSTKLQAAKEGSKRASDAKTKKLKQAAAKRTAAGGLKNRRQRRSVC